MSALARLLRTFDDALDWPEDVFLTDDHAQPAEDWRSVAGSPLPDADGC